MKPSEIPTPSSRSFSDVDVDFTKMKLAYFSNEFPKDDLQGLMRQLHTHSRDRRHPILAQFLDEATLAIREEVRQLPVPLRALIPPFETILNFSDFTALRTGPLCGSIDGILLCTVELGTFIGLVLCSVSTVDVASSHRKTSPTCTSTSPNLLC